MSRTMAILEKPGPLVPLGESVREASLSPNTVRAYRIRWERFEVWCRDRGLDFLSASPDTVTAYIVHLATDHILATLRLTAVAVSFAHGAKGMANPCGDRSVRETLRGLDDRPTPTPEGSAHRAMPSAQFALPARTRSPWSTAWPTPV